MLPLLIIAFSLFNVALAYFATQMFRRDQARRARRLAMQALRNAAAISVEAAPPSSNDRPATTPHEVENTEDSTADNAPDTKAANKEAELRPGVSIADITAKANRKRPTEPAEEQPPRDEPIITQITAAEVSPSAINPAEQPLAEELFYRSAELVNTLAEIDHSVLAGQAGEAPTEEMLADMSPQVTERAKPIEQLLPRVVEQLPEIESAASEIVAQCRRLAEEIGSIESREADAESGMHLLRDLFMTACEFRNKCEDALGQHGGSDHRLNGGQGCVAFENACNAKLESDAEHCAIGVEIDHLRELNSMYGPVAVNAILDQLPSVISNQLPDPDQVYRRHGQHFMALFAGDITSASAAADGIRRQIETTKFCFQEESIETTLSAAVVPLTLTGNELVERMTAALAEAKAQGHNRIASDHGDRIEVVAKSGQQAEPMEVIVSS